MKRSVGCTGNANEPASTECTCTQSTLCMEPAAWKTENSDGARGAKIQLSCGENLFVAPSSAFL